MMKWNTPYPAVMKVVALLMSTGVLFGCQPPTRGDFVKYPSLRQRWSLTCDPRSNIAEANVEGCKNFREWQAASQLPVLDNLMNQHLGK